MKLTIYILLALLKLVTSARILGIFQVPSVSHQVVFQPIWRQLAVRGHSVLIVTPNPLKDPSLTNLTEIDISEPAYKIIQQHGFQYFMSKEMPVQYKIHRLFQVGYDLSEVVFQCEDFIKIYTNTSEHFDLVLAQTYISPIMYSLAARFKAPLVGISSMAGWIGNHFALGNPHPPALYSEMFLSYNGAMTFSERFRSTWYYIWAKMYLHFIAYPKCTILARKYLGSDALPTSIEDVERNMSLLFLTTNPFLLPPRPTVPRIVYLEQLNIKPVRHLPQDLKQFMDEAKEGIIYFSLGSNVKSINIPLKLRSLLIETFAELPFKVLWKFESDNLPGQPKNVFIKKWIPQQDVLAHPNVKVFMTQCGLQSIEEAVARGVPMVGMPFIADQTMNIKRLEQFGVAVGVDYLTVTKEELKKALIKVATDKTYKTNIQELGKLWTDHPMKSLDRAIWWIEYVLRHKGTKHLRSPTADISWFEYLLIDVVAVSVLAITLAALIVVYFFKFLFRWLINNAKEKVQ